MISNSTNEARIGLARMTNFFPQAARVFLLDLWADSAGSIEQSLPCIAAAFAAWPDILNSSYSEQGQRLVNFMQVCACV